MSTTRTIVAERFDGKLSCVVSAREKRGMVLEELHGSAEVLLPVGCLRDDLKVDPLDLMRPWNDWCLEMLKSGLSLSEGSCCTSGQGLLMAIFLASIGSGDRRSWWISIRSTSGPPAHSSDWRLLRMLNDGTVRHEFGGIAVRWRYGLRNGHEQLE
eukprot:s165_g20.t2